MAHTKKDVMWSLWGVLLHHNYAIEKDLSSILWDNVWDTGLVYIMHEANQCLHVD